MAGNSGDIALIKLSSPLTFSSSVRPLCLPIGLTGQTFAQETGTTIGWGTTENGEASNFLREVS